MQSNTLHTIQWYDPTVSTLFITATISRPTKLAGIAVQAGTAVFKSWRRFIPFGGRKADDSASYKNDLRTRPYGPKICIR